MPDPAITAPQCALRASAGAASRTAGRTRWILLGLLFLATTINYVDRQVIGILKPTLSRELGWSDIDYGNIVFVFQMAYAIGYLAMGRITDLLGTKRGYSLSVLVWSVAAACHGAAQSVAGFGLARFALGLGEGGSLPACIKAVRAWFPPQERALASGVFNAGSNVGALATPLFVPWLTLAYGWQVTFAVTGAAGLVWLLAWAALYHEPSARSPLPPAGGVRIEGAPAGAGRGTQPVALPFRAVLRHRATWAYAAVQGLTSPVWWFYLFWLPDFLNRSHGLDLARIGPPLIVIYLMADVGSILGGWFSSRLVSRGMDVLAARKLAMLVCALFIVPVVFAAKVEGLWTATLLVGLAASAHQGWAANMFTLPSDTMPGAAVSSMAGIGGAVGAVGGMFVAQVAGHVLAATGNYVSLFVMVPCCYAVALLLLHLILPHGAAQEAR